MRGSSSPRWRSPRAEAAGTSAEECRERQADFDRAEADAREWLARWEATIGGDLDAASRAEERTEAAAARVDEGTAARRGDT